MAFVHAFPDCSDRLSYLLAKAVKSYFIENLSEDKRIMRVEVDCVLGRNIPVFDSKDNLIIDNGKIYRTKDFRVQFTCSMTPEILLSEVKKALYRKRGRYLLILVYLNREFGGHKAFAAMLIPWG